MDGSDVPNTERSAARRERRRVAAARERIRSLPGGWVAWRIGVTAVGIAIIVAGIILLPLPGPGWLIIFAGLGLLGTEYVWAKRLLGWVRDQFKRWTAWVARQPRWFQGLLGVLGLAVLAAIALIAWLIYH